MRLPILDPQSSQQRTKAALRGYAHRHRKPFQGFREYAAGRRFAGPVESLAQRTAIRQTGLGIGQGDGRQSLASAAVREVAILVTGSHFRSGYELYAHVLVAEQRGLSDEKLATIVAGQRPIDLTRQEAVAYDFAFALVNGGVLPELTYKAAVEQFGAHGAAELSYLIGVYCMVSVTLNTFDVPVPE